MAAWSCQRLVELHLVDDDPALKAHATEIAVAGSMAPRSDAEVAAEVAKNHEAAISLNASFAEINEKNSIHLGDVLGATSTVLGSQAHVPGVDPKTAHVLSEAAKVADVAADVANYVEAAKSRGGSMSARPSEPRASWPARERARERDRERTVLRSSAQPSRERVHVRRRRVRRGANVRLQARGYLHVRDSEWCRRLRSPSVRGRG